MKKCLVSSLVVAGLLAGNVSAANLLTNGGFENWSGTDVLSWTGESSTITTQAAALTEGSYALKTVRAAAGNSSTMTQSIGTALTNTFSFSFDFAQMGGTSTTGTLRVTLRDSVGSNRIGININQGGSLQLLSGAAYVNAATQFNGAVADSDFTTGSLIKYRLEMDGKVNGTYALKLTNLGDNSVVSATGLNFYGTSAADIKAVNLDWGRVYGTNVIDNVNLSVPEPASLGLGILSVFALLIRRNR